MAKKGEMRETALWCLARLGARRLFYGPTNQVLPVAAATRWVEALAKVAGSADALVSIARRTGDASRDLAPATVALVGRSVPEDLIPVLQGEADEDAAKIFGEELPSGLVMAEVS